MELKKYQIRKNEYTFVCEYWETSRAWGHKVTLFKNDYEMATNKVRYYNRTWECYRYQSCMRGAVCKAIEYYKQNAVDNYKYLHDITRLKQEEKDKIYAENEIIQELELLKKQI